MSFAKGGGTTVGLPNIALIVWDNNHCRQVGMTPTGRDLRWTGNLIHRALRAGPIVRISSDDLMASPKFCQSDGHSHFTGADQKSGLMSQRGGAGELSDPVFDHPRGPNSSRYSESI